MKNYYVHRHVPWEKQNKNSNIENNQGILKMYKYMLEWTPKPQLNKIMKMSQEMSQKTASPIDLLMWKRKYEVFKTRQRN